MFILRNVGKHKAEVLGDALIAYADALANDNDMSVSTLLEQYPDDVSALEELFKVSIDLHEMLAPVQPRPHFVSDLRSELRESQTALVASRLEQRRRNATRIANTLGTVVSILVVTALITRLLGVIIMLVTLRARRRRSAVAI